MPDWITKLVAEDWYGKYDGLSPILRMERTIDRLGQHFDVSRQMAKIRMAELGYADAEKAFSYYEKRHHTICFEKAARELAQNEDFRDALASGGYAYVDSCFVLRDKKYICRDETGTLHLTQYAKAHMAECCLAFAIKRGNRGIQYGMLRYNVEDETFIVGSGLPANELAKRSQNVAWSDADAYFDRVLDIDPKYAPAYIGKLCAELRVPAEERLASVMTAFSENGNFKKAVRFADAAYQAKLLSYDRTVLDAIENARAEGIYSKA